ncbi:FUSC family protein [Luteimonas sp. BDR2-5]|uniref:FUSC family protein n=1 Tax=Proluteimonas luteida TaxID=2878685 RepID=UPI001E3EE358|nr:FUSC family protein [Luteimonas sp. BDR2-5]MCD9028373.1 FUSC family protein [Luteimonas sp. BDR2-5]
MIPLHSLPGVVGKRLTNAFHDSLAAAVAAAIAWMLAQHLFGHPRPLFAAITAIVCLSPGLPSHGRQGIGVLVGVATGIVIGELTLLLPGDIVLLRISLAALLSMLVASTYGFAPVVPIQAGVSAVLVIAFGPATAGSARMLDVAAGAGVGLLFSQVLLTPSPVRIIDGAVQALMRRLASGFRMCADALPARDQDKAQTALKQISGAHDSVIALDAAIAAARSTARWSLRGRLAAAQVGELAARYDRRAVRLYASALLFAEALANALRKDTEAPPPGLDARVAGLADRCLALVGDAAQGAGTEAPAVGAVDPDRAIAPSWQSCLEHLQAVEESLAAFQRTAVSDGRE